jgi:hypothetical protein
MTHRRILRAIALLVVFGLLGCSGSRPVAEMTELTGQVTLNGRLVEKMIMNLSPLVPGEGREDECVVQGGAYRIKLIAGRYRVSFTQAPGGPVVPTKYRTADASQLVLDGTKSEPVNFELK